MSNKPRRRSQFRGRPFIEPFGPIPPSKDRPAGDRQVARNPSIYHQRSSEKHEMSVLVTGGAGYIGGHMTLALSDAGEKVVVVDNLSTGFAWAVPEAATLVVGDFGDSELIGRLLAEH